MTISKHACSIRRHLIYCGMIFLCAFVTFGPTLRVGFLWDDHEMIENNPHIRHITLANIKHAFSHDVFDGKGDAYYRPLQTLANMADYQLWGLNPFGYHATNFIFHVATAGFLYGFLALCFSPMVAFLTALGFSAHPVVVEQLLIIAGRAELMSAAFMFFGLWLRLKWGTRFLWGVCILYLLALLSKESGIVFPLLVVVTHIVKRDVSVSLKEGALYTTLAVLYLGLRATVVANPSVDFRALGVFVFRDFSMIVAHYIQVVLFPTDLHSHRRMVFSQTWLILGPLLLGLLVWLTWRLRSRTLTFALLWFVVPFLPKIPNLCSGQLILDHWAYISSAGVILLMALWSAQRPTRRMLFGVVVLFWAVMSWLNILGRSTDEDLYRWALRHPSSSIVRYNLGIEYYRARRYLDAKHLLEQSFHMNPSSFLTLNGLALVTWKLGDPARALQILDQALALSPNNSLLLENKRLIETAGVKNQPQ